MKLTFVKGQLKESVAVISFKSRREIQAAIQAALSDLNTSRPPQAAGRSTSRGRSSSPHCYSMKIVDIALSTNYSELPVGSATSKFT